MMQASLSLESALDQSLRRADGLPVSMKAVLVCRSHALILRQPDGLWELPGGRLEAGELALPCLVREVEEETGLAIRVDRILNNWIRQKSDGSFRYVITALAFADAEPDLRHVRLSPEHVNARFIQPDEQPPAPMLDGYLKDLRLASCHLSAGFAGMAQE